MRPLFLIGFMGCGKSTLCRALNRLTGIKTIDLDDYITEKAGISIKEYFRIFGEEKFRDFEHECLEQLASSAADTIVACGGGTPCFRNNMGLMERYGDTVLLEASLPVLFTRLARGRKKRPLIAALDDNELKRFIESKLADRMRFYSLATYRFESTFLENETEIDITAHRFIEQFSIPDFRI